MIVREKQPTKLNEEYPWKNLIGQAHQISIDVENFVPEFVFVTKSCEVFTINIILRL